MGIETAGAADSGDDLVGHDWGIWADAPGTPADGQFDTTALRRLLTMAGPQDAAELQNRLSEDLDAVQAMLSLAAARLDWDVLREQSHILTSLAGAVGAVALLRASQALNVAAHAQAQGTVVATMPATLAAISDLRTGIAGLADSILPATAAARPEGQTPDTQS